MSEDGDAIRTLDAETLKEIHEYSVDLESDLIYLEGSGEDPSEVDWSMARRFRKNLRAICQFGAISCVVDIDSPGGDETAGLSIYDAVRRSSVPLTGYVSGQASSMASVILQAFPKRVLARHASVMYHAGTAGTETPAQEFGAAAADMLRQGTQCDRIMYARAREKQPELTWDRFELAVMRGVYLSAEEAVAYGWADSIED